MALTNKQNKAVKEILEYYRSPYDLGNINLEEFDRVQTIFIGDDDALKIIEINNYLTDIRIPQLIDHLAELGESTTKANILLDAANEQLGL